MHGGIDTPVLPNRVSRKESDLNTTTNFCLVWVTLPEYIIVKNRLYGQLKVHLQIHIPLTQLSTIEDDSQRG